MLIALLLIMCQGICLHYLHSGSFPELKVFLSPLHWWGNWALENLNNYLGSSIIDLESELRLIWFWNPFFFPVALSSASETLLIENPEKYCFPFLNLFNCSIDNELKHINPCLKSHLQTSDVLLYESQLFCLPPLDSDFIAYND